MILNNYDNIRYSIEVNKAAFVKKFQQFVKLKESYQPLLCTYVEKKITSDTGIMYFPRSPVQGSIVCHLGEAHLGKNAQGAIIKKLNYI